MRDHGKKSVTEAPLCLILVSASKRQPRIRTRTDTRNDARFKEVVMADRVRKVNYVYMKVPNRAGNGAKILSELREEGVGLLAYTGFPDKRGKAQIDLVPEDIWALRRVAKKNGWRLSKAKKGFLITGRDDLGAVQRHINKLADKKINITAADAVAAGRHRYGMMLWVKPKDYNRASRVLGAK